MISREILKKNRQIELRTNRIVTAFAVGARASARFTARPSAVSKTNQTLNSIRPLKRRERRAPGSQNSKPLKFERFRNYGEFAIIKHQAGETPPVSISSNATGLEMRSAAFQTTKRMSKSKSATIEVQGTAITVIAKEHGDYISLTDMVRNFEGGGALIEQWLKNKDTVLFLGVWEQINNLDFNSLEFEGIRNEAGRNSFFLSAKSWSERTRAKGLIASAGRYGGTFAHKDIAFEFGSWLSPEFKLYLIKEFQRLKEDENRRLSLAWNLNRTLSKLNYRIHTDAVKTHLIPPAVTPAQAAITYATEADLLNVALFGHTARQPARGTRVLPMSFQPPAQIRRIPRAVPEGADNHLGSLAFDYEEHVIRPRFWHFGFLSQAAGEGKSFRVLANCFEETLQILGKSLADSRLALVVKRNRLGEFPFGLLLDDHPKTHRAARNRFSMSATTSSSGRQRSGCASARSARRSSSAVCSGVSWSSNRSRRCSKTSRCSSNGSRFTCSMTCAALMALIYSTGSRVQAGFFRRAASRCSISENTFSAGIHACGFFSNSATRRSSPAIGNRQSAIFP
jgi:hypothetical protein